MAAARSVSLSEALSNSIYSLPICSACIALTQRLSTGAALSVRPSSRHPVPTAPAKTNGFFGGRQPPAYSPTQAARVGSVSDNSHTV